MTRTQLSHPPYLGYSLIKWGAKYSGNSVRQGIQLTQATRKKKKSFLRK